MRAELRPEGPFLWRLPALAFGGRLARHVRSLNRALDVQRRRQADADRLAHERAELVSTLGVEIRQAAASVAGLAEALESEAVCEPLGVRQARAVTAILTSARRLTGLAAELDHPAMTGASAPAPDRLDPVHALRAATERLAPRLNGLGVRVALPSVIAGLGVHAWGEALDDLLARLIEQTAILAGPGGVVVLEVCQTQDVRIICQAAGHVIDHERLAHSLRSGGLDLAAWRARSLGGELEADVRPGVGARLTLRLPRAGHGVRKVSPLPPACLECGNVLVIGADGPDRALIRLLGSALGLEGLYMAEDMPTGLTMIRELKPDVLILDAAMPRADAPTLVRALDEDPLSRNAGRLALLPAAPGVDQARRLREQGFRHVLARPLNIGDLAFALHAASARPAPSEDA